MDSFETLVNIFMRFPTVGKRTAMRFVYYLLRLPNAQIVELTNAIQELKNRVRVCQNCFNPFEGENNLCSICRDSSRNKNLLCIVGKETDLSSLEGTKKYNGLYFILGGTINAMRKEDTNNPKIEELKKRVAEGNFSEIIVALNPTPEGRATSMLIEREIKDLSKNAKITHLAKGLPVGGELEYADEETLESALEGRK
jgi:recombination protein RecR